MFVRFSKVVASVLTIAALIGGQLAIPASAAGSYTVIYNGNGNDSGVAPTDPLSPYNPNVNVTVLGNTGGLVKTGYSFTGWNTATNGSGTDYAPGSTFSIKNSVTLYAKWTINTYTVTYDGNGSTGGTPPSSVTQNYNTTFTVSGAGTLIRTGYTFAGWNTAANGSGSAYLAGATFTITSNVTLYALWTINTYSLTYSAGAGGSISGSTSQTVTYGGSGSTVTAVANTGYSFVSWSDGVLTASRTDSNVTGNLSVTANFAINTFTLTYIAGANGSITGALTQSVTYGGKGTSVTAVPNAGYRFTGWSDGVLTATRSESNVTSSRSFTANFVLDTFTLNYSAGANGSISGTTSQTVVNGGSGTAVTALPNTEYSFVSWSDGVLTATRIDSNVIANLSVTAFFAINSYTLNYIAGANGTISGVASQVINHGDSGTSVTAVPNIGYSFVSWSDGVLTATRTDSNITANLSVTATFAINSYALNYGAEPNGTISGFTSQAVNYGGNGAAVTAVPNTGYSFVSWSDGLTTATRTDLNVTADLSVTANFAINTYVLTYTAGANGSISGLTSQNVDYGIDGESVTAVPDTGYSFVSWSDGVLTATRTDFNITENISVTAIFAINNFSLNYIAGANGTISGVTSQTLSYGGSGTSVTAVPETGYRFVGWSDGVLTATRADVNITANISVTATFAINTYVLDYGAGPNGTIAGVTSQAVNYGGSGTAVMAVPNTGYSFVSWNDGVLTATRTDFNVTENIFVTAIFAINTYALTYSAGANGLISGLTSQNVDYGTDGTSVTAVPDTGYSFVGWSDGVVTATRTDSNVIADLSVTATFAINSYTLTYSAGANGSISGVASQAVNFGGNGTEVTAVPNTGYSFVSWSDGLTAATRTDLNVTADLSVTANFAINSFSLNYIAGANGTISGNVSQVVNFEDSGTPVTATPASGYSFISWSDGVLTPTRTDSNVIADLSVTASFAINSYTLTYSAGANGSVSGNASQAVNFGGNGAAVTAVPNTGYSFVSWSDGVLTATRTDSNVLADLAVIATFAINSYTLTYSAGANGSVSGLTSQTVDHGGNGSVVTAVPNTGYSFVSWSDGMLSATRNETNVLSNINITANFGVNAFALIYSAYANGTISGNLSQVVEFGETGTSVTAVPNTGYSFVSWSDGVLTATRTDSGVTSNISVTANFAVNTYTLSYLPGPNGSISGVTSQTLNYGDGGSAVTAVPDTGYSFVSWSDGVLTATRSDSNITADFSVIANFELNSYTLSFDGNGYTSGNVPAAQVQDYNTTAVVPSGNSISRSGYSFIGWNSSADGSGTTYLSGSTFTFASDVMLFAQWNQETQQNTNNNSNNNSNNNNSSNNNSSNNSINSNITNNTNVVTATSNLPSETPQAQSPQENTQTNSQMTSNGSGSNSSSQALTRPLFTTDSGSNVVQLNKTTRLNLFAEGGQVVATYSTMTPDICSVSAEGVVTGIHGGTCSILASITGSNSYLVTTPTVIVLTVEDSFALQVKSSTPKKLKNTITVTRKNGRFNIKLNFVSSYGYKVTQLQIGIRNSLGKITYRSIASILLNSQGNGAVIKRATYAKSIYIRALVNKKTVVSKKIV